MRLEFRSFGEQSPTCLAPSHRQWPLTLVAPGAMFPSGLTEIWDPPPTPRNSDGERGGDAFSGVIIRQQKTLGW